MVEEHQIKLADAIDELRRELSAAVARGRGQAVQFELGQVTMEFEVALTTTVEGRGGVQFWVLSMGASAGRAGAVTHRVSIALTPVVEGRRNPLISERRIQER